MQNKILIVGAGPMALEYAKVLKSMNAEMVVVGRSAKSASQFEMETDIPVITGGLDTWLKGNEKCPHKAIVCVTENLLGDVTRQLIQRGVKSILVEKPGGLNSQDIRHVAAVAEKHAASVYVGYNRRFYASTQKAREIIQQDGGVTSFNFEFTEWSHVIETLEKAEGVKEEWFLSNSTHVIDHAFFLGGTPQEISCYTSGGLSWHPRASIYAGAGRTVNGALFSYQANWAAPGRWCVEILTRKHRLIFKPMEKLSVQKIGSVATEEIAINDELDRKYKPGIYKQVEMFLSENQDDLQTMHEQVSALSYYDLMNKANGK